VQRDLLLRRREGPRHLESTLLAKHETHLSRRPQAVRMVRSKGRAWARLGERAEVIPVKEAALATSLRGSCARARHTCARPQSRLAVGLDDCVHQSGVRPPSASVNPGKRGQLLGTQIPAMSGTFDCWFTNQPHFPADSRALD
jgi:hypothetical protein